MTLACLLMNANAAKEPNPSAMNNTPSVRFSAEFLNAACTSSLEYDTARDKSGVKERNWKCWSNDFFYGYDNPNEATLPSRFR